jgi:iron complex outermembrane receptor protein
MKRSNLCCGLAVAAVAGGAPGATVAQAPSATAAPAGPLEEVIVTGIRGSQRQAIDIKKAAVNSVDAIASEDLGKMPDQNVAESLQRLPGVTIDRVRGVGNGVTVRGLGPQFNTVTLNGRVLATDGAGREFNFDVLPPELIAGADVYKSPQADLNGSSIGATVNIHTLRPLEQKVGLQAGGSVRANIDELGGHTTPSGALYGTWKSDSGRLGISTVLSYDDKNERTDDFFVGASSYPRSFDDDYYGKATNNGGTLCVGSVSGGVCNARIANNVTLFRNVDMYHNFVNQVEISRRKRTGFDTTVQYDASSELRLTLDALVSYDDEHLHNSGIVPDFSGGTLVNQVVSGGSDTTETVAGQSRTVHVGGTALSESFTNGTVDEIVQNDPATSLTELFGANAKWAHDAFTVALDVDTSRARYRNPNGLFTTIRLKGIDYTYDRRTGSPIASFTVSNPNYSPVATDVDHRLGHYMQTDSPMQSQAQNFDDTIYEGRLDAKWDGGDVAVYGGLGYSHRTKETTGFTEPNACAYCGSDVVLPASLFTPTNYNIFGGRGGGNATNWVDYNANALFDELVTLNTTANPALHLGSLQPIIQDPAASSSVAEKVGTAYLMTEFHGHLGEMPLAVNTGFRVEITNFTSDGAGQTVLSARPNGTGQNVIVLSDLTPLHFSGHYTDILPSLNARLSLTDTLILRAAASRVVSRPTLTDLSPAQSITSNPGNERITRGNPDLLPFRASQFEFGLESYFNLDSIASATAFYKSIDSFISRGVSTQLVDQVSFIIDQPVNGKGASVQGVELSYRTVFNRLPSPLDGLGTQISYTYTDSNANYFNAAKVGASSYTLQGLSKNSFTFVGFYEKGPLQARLSYTWRDHYLVAPQTQTGVPNFSDTYKQLDAGLQYSINSHFIITADAVNLTNSKEFTYANIIQDTQSYREVGRRYTVGVRAKY